MDNLNTSIVPYHDPYDDDDSSSLFNILLFDENPTIDAATPLDENPTNLNSDFGVSEYDPFFDPVLLDISYECSNHHLVGNSTNEEGHDPRDNNNSHNCQILREITHADGLVISKLGIFGTIGRISHANLEKYTMDFSDQSHLSSQTFDFSNDSISSVKQFLVQYFEACKHDGYMVLEDPLCEFYQALSVGFDVGDCINIDALLQFSPTTPHDIQMEQQEMANESEGTNSDVRHRKIPLSAQRERTGKLKLKDFAGYLHLPIEKAAKKLKICPTVMKKICRRDGLSRWPYRKIKSIKRKISERGTSLSSIDVVERESAEADIEKLEEELANIFEAFNDK